METNFSSAMCLQIDQVILMHEWINFNARSVVLNVLILMNLISFASAFSKVRYYWHSNVYDRFSFPKSFDVHFVKWSKNNFLIHIIITRETDLFCIFFTHFFLFNDNYVQKLSWTGMATGCCLPTCSCWLRVDQLHSPEEQLSW